MPIVAIAGGTSIGIGRSIIQAILQTYPNGEWNPIILSRSQKQPAWFSTLERKPEIKAVDYKDASTLLSALKGVHTLISVILAIDGTHASSQVALLDAAVQSDCKRFVPSEWACGPKGVLKVDLLAAAKTPVWEACEKSGIEWSRFNVGSFMNYLGIGCGENEDEACAGVDREGDMPDGSGSFLISFVSDTAELLVKDDGTVPRVTMTEIGDVGRFVATALELERWERDMDVAGDTVRLDEVVDIAERVTGKKFDVRRLGRKELEKQVETLVSEQDMLKRMWVQLKLMMLDDEVGSAVLKPVVNELCPGIQAISVEKYLTKYWAKKGL
ncbi:NAD(P)-binding protein [Cadophora sp. DSE1049]|nr:NAD(P)-binding protein [Cadophora sp. DSE1049]